MVWSCSCCTPHDATRNVFSPARDTTACTEELLFSVPYSTAVRGAVGVGSEPPRPHPRSLSRALARYALPTCRAALCWAASVPPSAGGVAQAYSLRGGILATTSRCWSWLLVRTRLRAGITFMPDRLDDRNDHIQLHRGQDGERRTTPRIVSTAGAAAWLPHSIRGQSGLEAVSLPRCGMGTRYDYLFVL